MGTTSFITRVRTALDNLFRPSISVVETVLFEDDAERHPEELHPTKRQWSESVKAALGLLVRVVKTARKRRRLRAALRTAVSAHDAATKTYLDQAASPGYIHTREREEKFRGDHPLHEERVAFRQVRIPRWMSTLVDPIVVIADWGVWFGLFMTGEALTFTKATSATDPSPAYDPNWFFANPLGWAVAFAVPPLMAFGALAIVRVAARVWALDSALRRHPERADDLEPGGARWVRWLWLLGVLLASITFYGVAVHAFSENLGKHSDLAPFIAIPWAAASWIAFLVRRFGQDPIAEVNAVILGAGAQARTVRETNAARVIAAEDAWRGAFDALDSLIRWIVDAASADLHLFDQIHMRADARSGRGLALAPIADVTAARAVEPAEGRPLRAVPVTLVPQRGLATKVAGWITRQIEQDIETLDTYRPAVETGAARIERLESQFEARYEAAVAKRDERISSTTGASTVASVPADEESADASALLKGAQAPPFPEARGEDEARAASGPIVLDPREQHPFDKLADEAGLNEADAA